MRFGAFHMLAGRGHHHACPLSSCHLLCAIIPACRCAEQYLKKQEVWGYLQHTTLRPLTLNNAARHATQRHNTMRQILWGQYPCSASLSACKFALDDCWE